MKIIYAYILILFFLPSCHGKRLATENFMPIDDFSQLNGRYFDEEAYWERIFNIYDNEMDIDIVDVEFRGKDSLIISYTDTGGCKKIHIKGKTKKNFFEIYLTNIRIYLPPILVINNIDRLRIGKDKEEKLLIYKWDEHYGIIIPLGAGGSINNEYQRSFSHYNKNVKEGLYAIQIGRKWGYANREDSIVIAPIYDYAFPFKDGIAKVARDKRWGYIDKKNKEIIPLIYDTIMKPERDIIRVCKDGKWGLIDSLNREVATFKYDRLFVFGRGGYYDSLFLDLAEVHIDNKVGFINKQGKETIPAKYDKIEFDPYGSGKIKFYRSQLGDKYGYVSGNGILCNPIFNKAGKQLGYNGFSPKNKTLADEIGRYSEVIYNGKPYLFTEKGILYKYKKLGFFKENRLVVDFDSGFLLKDSLTAY
ncbi:MAG: WG repeat-containing protein [Prevotella sp.]|jgi:hypothetical protein|nr:WG repeat-containing protein [Prevotella sp.]